MSTGLRFTLEVDGLPPDTLAVTPFHLEQFPFSLFTLNTSLASQQLLSIDFSQVLERTAHFKIWQGTEIQRRMNGIVTWLKQGENDGHQMLYSMIIRPPAQRASLWQNSRIFQNEDIKSILGMILQENGVTDWSSLFSETHSAREFCVQYGETDYDFLARMAAEGGLFFHEEHSPDSDDQSLVLCDTVHSLLEALDIPWNPNTRTEVSTPCISQFRHGTQIRPSSVIGKDYTFKRPGQADRFEQQGWNQDYQRIQYEVFDHPGRSKDGHGQNFACWQVEGWCNNAEKTQRKSRSPAIWPGRRIQLTEHPQAGLNRKWQVVSSDLQGKQPQAVAGRSGSGATLENDFTVIPADRTWRPRPVEKPPVDGPQSATVTGPEGEEISCNEHGRVRVKFNWDRYNPANQDSSYWIRVVQAWAGPGFGNLAIPRVDQEVIVDFLNGDPDQLIIMGRMYHVNNPPSGGLPETKTQTTIHSRTYKGSGYNKLMFEDKIGQELSPMHAQKDMKTAVLNDQGMAIVRNQSLVVGNNRLKVVTASEDVKIDGYQLLNIRQFQEVNAKTDVTCFNGGDRTMQSAGNVVIESGSMIRLECGESALELHTGGVINLKGKAFNVVAEGNSLITTGIAMLDPNPKKPASAIGIVGDSHKKDLTSIIQGLFPEEVGGGK